MSELQGFEPYRIIEIELTQPLPELSAVQGRRVLAMVRMHTRPVGVVELELGENGLTAQGVAERIWQALGQAIHEHYHADGMPDLDELTADGLPVDLQPACLQQRQRVLANAPFVSILVATHNRVSTLAVTLESLLRLDYPRFEIIVIDNAPADDQAYKFIQQKYGDSLQVRYVREDTPGLAAAHNCGLREARARYVAITDDDVTVDPHWLTELMSGFSRAKNVGCVTGTIFPAEIQTQAQYWVERGMGYTKGYQSHIFNMNGHRPSHPLFPFAAGMFGSGANMAFDATILRKTGGFDNRLGAGSRCYGGDDLASFFQIIVNGYTLVYEPAAIVYHTHYREYERLRKTVYGYGAGLTAFLTKSIIDHPGQLFNLALRAPYGLYYALSARSPKNSRKTSDYPRELDQIERRGMIAGPWLYLRERLSGKQDMTLALSNGKLEGKVG